MMIKLSSCFDNEFHNNKNGGKMQLIQTIAVLLWFITGQLNAFTIPSLSSTTRRTQNPLTFNLRDKNRRHPSPAFFNEKQHNHLHNAQLYLSSSSSSSSSDVAQQQQIQDVETDPIETITSIFSAYCDIDGLMSKQSVLNVPYIADLLVTGDLLMEEFDSIFDKAPKFPDPTSTTTNDSSDISAVSTVKERIDIDSFVQIYRDIDDLFEPDDDNDTVTTTIGSNFMTSNPNLVSSNGKARPLIATTNENDNNDETATTTPVNVAVSTNNASTMEADTDEEMFVIDGTINGDESDPSLEGELEAIYERLCDAAGYISKEQLRVWDEVDKLVLDGLLGEDEFQNLWDSTTKSVVYDDKLDLDGFLSFNVALDDLFAFDDEEMEDEYVDLLMDEDNNDSEDDTTSTEHDTPPTPPTTPVLQMVNGEGLSPDELFVALANVDGLIGIDELKRWREVQEMITDGDLLDSELLEIFNSVQKSEMDLNKLQVEGFIELYNAIDDLFEDDDAADGRDDGSVLEKTNVSASSKATEYIRQVSHKDELLDAIIDLQRDNELPCGLDASELEQREILSIVEMVENDNINNLIRSRQGNIEPQELNGEWELLYSSSSAMKFNQGLSGLGGSVPNGRFGTLRQKLTATKFLTDVEYTEHIILNPSSASFDVKVTGTWDLRMSVSLFTGEPSIVMNVVPDRVSYGPTSTRADHWKSLGPMNMLDISYLDDDLRIMRGNTSIDTIFIFRRILNSKSANR